LSFDLGVLLRAKNFNLTTEHLRDSRPDRDTENALWQDSSGPLRLSRVESSVSTHYRLHLDADVAVDILPDRQLRILASPEIPGITIEHFLADQVVPRLVAQDGDLVLHSGAILVEGKAILILGESGRGKSTLVTSFHCHGWPLMGDDACKVSTDPAPSAEALYPSLRLFADSIAALLPSDAPTQEMAHYSDKLRISATFEKIESGPSPIESIFVLGEPSAIGIDVVPLTIAEACMAIVENSFALDPTDPQRARQRLKAASDLARQVPAFALSYPRDYARLPEVRDAILGALRGD